MNNNQIIILLGPPCVGKGTLSYHMQKYNQDFIHLSIGALLRSSFNPSHPISHKLRKGELVSNSLIGDLILHEIKKYKNKKIILDGFPRTEKQMKWVLKSDLNISQVIILSASMKNLIDRMKNRRVCTICEKSYSINSKDFTENCCNQKVVQRSDDTLEVYKKRYDIFRTSIDNIQKNFLSKIIHIVTDEKIPQQVLHSYLLKSE